MSPEEKLRLSHIVEAADRIAEYLQGISKESFLKDILRQDAVIRKDSNHRGGRPAFVSGAPGTMPDFPAKEARGMRNVWSTITRE